MKEWDYTNNYLFCDPDKILDRYSKNIWWTCEVCNYHYYMAPKMRLYYQKRRKKSCPYCKGRRRKKKYFF